MRKLVKKMNKWPVFWSVFFSVFQVIGMLGLPTITADIIDYGVVQQNTDYIISRGVLMIVITFLSIIGSVIATYLAAKESQGLGERLRNEMFEKVIYFSNEEIDSFGTSTLMTRSTNDIMQIQFVMMQAIRILGINPILILGAFGLAFVREPMLAIVFLVTMPLLVLVIWLVIRFVGPLFRKLQMVQDVLNRIFREGLTGIRVVRAFNKDEYEEERFDKSNKDFRKISVKVQTILAIMMPAMIVIVSLSNVLIIWFGSRLVAVETMQVGNLVAFLSYAQIIMMGVMLMSMVFTFIPRAQVAVERVDQVLNTKSKINNPEKIKDPSNAEGIELSFEDVDFKYPLADGLALEGIDFSVKQGETLAIIGGTGSGKTSIANLLIRLYDVHDGHIRVNGVDIRSQDQYELRKHIGFAPQDAILFEGTIRENLTYGKEDATDEEIWHALDIAQGYDFVKNLENGLESRVEHGGGNFSGGQRQRLSIARALVTDASMLVFDDSFSALDYQTDAKLRKALVPETKEKVVVIIAQRISTVLNADTIVVLDNGRVVGKGTHQGLKANNEYYQEIMESQMKGEDI